MLYTLLNANRDVLTQRVCESIEIGRQGDTAARAELRAGVAEFVSQLSDLLFLRHADPQTTDYERRTEIGRSAARHAATLQTRGLGSAQVEYAYAEIGRSLLALAAERDVSLAHEDFVAMHLCVDAAVEALAPASRLARDFGGVPADNRARLESR